MSTKVTEKRFRKRILVTILIFATIFIALISIFPYNIFASDNTNSYSINKIQSGLVASDGLNNQQLDFLSWMQADMVNWSSSGDAPLRGAPYITFTDTQGLHIGIRAPTNGSWAGYYSVSPNTNAALFHAIVSAPVRTIPFQSYSNGLYVQTSKPTVNYVTCFAGTNAHGTIWKVVSATGDLYGAKKFHTLWVDPKPNQPLTRDCTIITNGNNYLRVYLDGVRVYSNNTLDLQMPPPYNTYLEPQSSYPGQMLNGTFKDYYATTDENVQIINNLDNASTARLVTSSGVVLASTHVNSRTATINIGQFHLPVVAYIKVYDKTGIQLASTPNPVKIFGGDSYSINPKYQFFKFDLGILFKS